MSARKTWFSSIPRMNVASRVLIVGGIATLIPILVLVIAVHAQIPAIPSWAGSLLLGNSTITADPTLTAPEAQGLGQKFELLFAMTNNQDPQNNDNDVISVFTTPAYPAGIGVAVRNMLPGAKVGTLTGQINIKYYFPARSCNGGSPRIQLYVSPGDGTSPHNAFGYVGHAAFGVGCLTGIWDVVDLANLLDPTPRWELSQWTAYGSAAFCTGANPFVCTWAQVVTFFNTALPNHQVLSGGVFDDSCSFAPASCGQAYYDLLTIENRTLENRQDTVQGPTH